MQSYLNILISFLVHDMLGVRVLDSSHAFHAKTFLNIYTLVKSNQLA